MRVFVRVIGLLPGAEVSSSPRLDADTEESVTGVELLHASAIRSPVHQLRLHRNRSQLQASMSSLSVNRKGLGWWRENIIPNGWIAAFQSAGKVAYRTSTPNADTALTKPRRKHPATPSGFLRDLDRQRSRSATQPVPWCRAASKPARSESPDRPPRPARRR